MKNVSSILSQLLSTVESEATKLFESLTEGSHTYNFLNDVKSNGIDWETYQKAIAELKETNEFGSLPCLSITDSFTGEVMDFHILSVCGDAIHVINSIDNCESTVRFIDLSGIDHQLVLLNEMENLL